ncbi:alpha/beta hydrolase [Metasolibacillus meyeri]|uniref:Alpha/beta hydrolase n=1 Tax=Metasolibacillus meyeri TaxID=1071052 RepID=A0AAW9NYM5_9BACL|nr:alpha/beta hydrolase [Metasolibacillus meyeri]MEC1180588.1 alpha/beta hydrolase [Metasolibacillus meyeri]
MRKIIQPKSIFLKGGEKAVLLLHSFTSNTVDVKKLGRFLNQENYTCFAPLYEGHGLSSEQLLLTDPNDWWKSVERGYRFLKNEGYHTIAVIGVSLGGIFALNAGQQLNVNGVVTMSVPYKRDIDTLKNRVLNYALTYKQLEGKDKVQISHELDCLKASSFNSLLRFQEYIDLTMEGLSSIEKPICILYGELDEALYKESAEDIYQNVSSQHKSVKGYPNSSHLMTLGEDQEEIQTDILSFLNHLQW